MKLIDYCESISACEDALNWIGDKSLSEAWETCNRGDWMIWLINNSENDVTDKQLRLIAVDCARQVQHLMTDQRSINALDVAERYANGEATYEELAAARAAAWAAARDAAWAAAGAAGDAAWAAAWAARAAAGDAARDAAWGKQAEIVRKYVPIINIKNYE
jgi:hypothetical protein